MARPGDGDDGKSARQTAQGCGSVCGVSGPFAQIEGYSIDLH
jgi:hypothetical protein